MRNHRSDALVGSLFVLGAIVSWGAYFPFAKLILQKLSPLVFLVFRFGIGAAVLFALSLQQGKSFRIQRRDWLGVALAAAVGIVLHQFIQLAALERTSATNTGWIITLIPPVAGIMAWVFLRERITLRQGIGLGIAMTGVVLFISNGRITDLSLGRNFGDLLAFGSVLTWSAYTIITKSRLQRYDPLPLSAIYMGLGCVVFFSLGAGSVVEEASRLTASEWIIVVLIGVIPTGLAYYWWNAGLLRLGTMNTSMFLFIEAIVASVVSYLVLGELFSTVMIAFAAVMVIGVYIAQTKGRADFGGGE
jgi:drug/metabolite transporter (DMT)-like permease